MEEENVFWAQHHKGLQKALTPPGVGTPQQKVELGFENRVVAALHTAFRGTPVTVLGQKESDVRYVLQKTKKRDGIDIFSSPDAHLITPTSYIPIEIKFAHDYTSKAAKKKFNANDVPQAKRYIGGNLLKEVWSGAFAEYGAPKSKKSILITALPLSKEAVQRIIREHHVRPVSIYNLEELANFLPKELGPQRKVIHDNLASLKREIIEFFEEYPEKPGPAA
ncbi:hypothetical protein ACFLQ2_02990 [archaeon]